MSEKKKSGNFLKIILGRPSKQTNSLQDSQSGSSSPKDASSKTCKGAKVERRESTRLQNAAKLLRNLSKSKDVAQIQDDEDKDEGPPPPLPDRKNPVYQSEGKGRRREGKESSKPDRSHSFHGKPDKKERKYAAIERKLLESSKSCSKLEKIANEERIRREAKSILLTEDNLAPIHKPVEKSPDLIQGLPDISKLPLSSSRDSVHDSAQLTTNAKENSQQIKDDKDEIDFSFESDIVSQSSASLNNQADSRSLDPRISDSDSHYFSLVQPPRSLLLQSRDPQHQPRSLVQQHIIDGGQDQPRVQGPPGDQGPPGGQNWPRLTDEKNPEDPVYSTIDETGSVESLALWSQTILDSQKEHCGKEDLQNKEVGRDSTLGLSSFQDDETYGFAPLQTNSPALKTSPSLKVSPGPKTTPSPTFPDFHPHLQPRSTGHFQSLPYLLNQAGGEESEELVEYALKYQAYRHTSRRTRPSAFNLQEGHSVQGVQGVQSVQGVQGVQSVQSVQSVPDVWNRRRNNFDRVDGNNTDGGSGRNSVVSFSSTDTLRYPEPGSTDTLRYPDPGSNDTLRYPDPGSNDTQRYREPSRSPFSPYRLKSNPSSPICSQYSNSSSHSNHSNHSRSNSSQSNSSQRCSPQQQNTPIILQHRPTASQHHQRSSSQNSTTSHRQQQQQQQQGRQHQQLYQQQKPSHQQQSSRRQSSNKQHQQQSSLQHSVSSQSLNIGLARPRSGAVPALHAANQRYWSKDTLHPEIEPSPSPSSNQLRDQSKHRRDERKQIMYEQGGRGKGRLGREDHEGRDGRMMKEKGRLGRDDFSFSKSVPNLLTQSKQETENIVTHEKKGDEKEDCEEEGEGEEGEKGEENEELAINGSYDNEISREKNRYLDPAKKLMVSDNTIKRIQKQAVIDYYNRLRKGEESVEERRKETKNTEEDGKRNETRNLEEEEENLYRRRYKDGSEEKVKSGSEKDEFPSPGTPRDAGINSRNDHEENNPRINFLRSLSQGEDNNSSRLTSNPTISPGPPSSRMTVSNSPGMTGALSSSPRMTGYSSSSPRMTGSSSSSPRMTGSSSSSPRMTGSSSSSPKMTGSSSPRLLTPEPPPPPPLDDLEELEVVCNDPLPPPPPPSLQYSLSLRADSSSSGIGTGRNGIIQREIQDKRRMEEGWIGEEGRGRGRPNSPARIAAKAAAGWERFLGPTTSAPGPFNMQERSAPGSSCIQGRSATQGASTVQERSAAFTSDHAVQFRRTKKLLNARSEDSGAKSLSCVLDSLTLNPLQARSPALHRSSPNLNRNSLILQSSPTQPTEEVCSPSRRRSSSRQSSPRRSSSYRRSGGCREIRESTGSEESSSHLWWNNNQEKVNEQCQGKAYSNNSADTAADNRLKSLHNHSSSDSGLSSLSGGSSYLPSTGTSYLTSTGGRTSSRTSSRSSCLSPLSILSFGSSSGSSRASLRSGSIVSSTTIPLEEEEEELSFQLHEALYEDDIESIEMSTALLQVCKPSPQISQALGVFEPCDKSALDYLSDVLELGSRPPSLQSRLRSSRSSPSYSASIDFLKCRLLSRLENKLSNFLYLQELGKAEQERNEERNKELLEKLSAATSQKSYVDKYRVQVDELNKICLLLISLACRLAKTQNSLNSQNLMDGGTSLRRKEEKLLEQFTEAQELKTSVYKRVSTVSAFIQELLGDQEQSLHTLYTRVRVQLLVQQRLLADKIEITEQKIAALRTL